MLKTFVVCVPLSGAILLFFVALYFLGPRLLQRFRLHGAPGSIVLTASAAIGATVLAWCYAQRIAFQSLQPRVLFVIAAVALAALAWTILRGRPRPGPRALAPLLPYAFLWLLWCAVYAWRSVGPEMSYMTAGNNDIWSYLKFANLALLGDSADNIVGYSLRDSIMNFQGQVSYFLVAITRQVFGISGELAFTVLTVTLLTLMTWLMYRICRKHIGLGSVVSTTATITAALSGITFLLVAFGFLNQLIGCTLVLLIFYIVLDRRGLWWTLASLTLAFYFLLLTYLPSILIFLPLYLLVVTVVWIRPASGRNALPDLVRSVSGPAIIASAPLLAAGLLALIDFPMFQRKIEEALWIKDVAAGWTYRLLEPLTVIVAFMPPDAAGLPMVGGSEATKYVGWALLAAPCLILALTAALRVWRHRRQAAEPEGAPSLVIWLTGCACVAIYLLYFTARGESYQQWKLALTLLAPFGFILIAAPFAILRQAAAPDVSAWGMRIGVLMLAGVAVTSAIQQDLNTRMIAWLRFATYPPLAGLARQVEAGRPSFVNIDTGDDVQASMSLTAAIQTTPLRNYSPNYFRSEGDAAPLGRADGVTILSRCWLLADRRRLPDTGFCSTDQMRAGDGYELGFDILTSHAVLGGGWSFPEAWGRWTDGPRAEMRIPVNADWSVATVELEGGPMLACGGTQRVRLLANGAEVVMWEMAGEGDYQARIPRDLFGPEEVVLLTFDLPDAVAPASCGASDDIRQMGLGMRLLRVTPG